VRTKNVSATAEYISTVRSGGRLEVDRRALAPQERVEDALFTGLRLAAGLDLELIRSRYGVDVRRRFGPELQPFIDDGLLRYDSGRLRLTRSGMLLAHEVMAIFIGSPVR
jgi:oxygen-independent coproporphyrinogen-3 oxidase